MKIVFLDQATMGDDISFSQFEELGDYTGWPLTSPEEIADRISDAEVVIVNKVVLGKREIDSAPRLRLICVAATGTNNIDSDYAASKGIPSKKRKGLLYRKCHSDNLRPDSGFIKPYSLFRQLCEKRGIQQRKNVFQPAETVL
jgi:Lactate dehydrogenase and related dehydrogenases